MTTEEKKESGGPLDMIARRLDAGLTWLAGWTNPTTGQGTDRDKLRGNQWAGGIIMSTPLLEDLFAFNDLAYAIVTALPEWGLRHGFDLALGEMTGEPGGGAADAQRVESALRSKLDELGAHELQVLAGTWGQLHGGGLILLGARDGKKTNEPLDLENLKSLEWIRVVPGAQEYVNVESRDAQVDSGRFGEPVIYRVQEIFAGVAAEPTLWHYTRVIRYPGARTPPRKKQQKQGWDLSILDRVVSKLSLHDTTWDNVGAMVADGSQGVWKIKGLMQAALTGKAGALQERFRIADQARSMFRSLLLDSDGESFDYVHRQFGGIADLLAQSAIRTAAAAQMPVTVLYGQSPAGMNATGESDIRLWYDRVEQYQEDVLRSRLEQLVRLVLRSKEGPTGGVEPPAWRVNFRPVRKETPMEGAELRARQAQIDVAYINAGVLAALEVALSRFTSEGWSGETQIDVPAREKAMRAAIMQLVGLAKAGIAAAPALGPKSAPEPAPRQLPPPGGGPANG